MEPLSIGALIAALVGAGANYIGNEQASKAVNNATNEAMLNQGKYSDKIQQMALDRANDYETSTRQQQQDAITKELENTYVSQPTDAVSIAQDASTTQGDTSSDYASAKSASDARVKNNIATFGKLMANVNGAKQLRFNENLVNSDIANNVGVQQALMKSQNMLDNYKIQQAQQKGEGLRNLGSMASLASSIMGIGAMANGLANLGTQGTQIATEGALEGAGDFTAKGTDAMAGFKNAGITDSLNQGNIMSGVKSNFSLGNTQKLAPKLWF